MTAHSLLGASGASRWLACPGSFHLSRLVGSDKGSEDARLGTAAHKLAERCFLSGEDAWELVGQEIDGFPVASNQANAVDPDAVQVYLDYIRGIDRVSLFSEVEHTFGKLYRPNEYFWGTADFVAVDSFDIDLTVVDYKNGVGVEVQAEGSPQLMYYAWGAINELSYNFGDGASVLLAIVQPRAAYGPPIREWWTTVGHIRQWAETVLLPSMQRAIEGADELVDGEHCRFCPALLSCPKVRGNLEELAMATISEDTSDETLDALYLKAQTARMVIKAIENQLLTRATAGARFQNVKLVRKRSERTWKEGADAKLLALLGEDAWNKKLLSPAQAEKLGTKMKDFVAENAFLPEGDGYTLKPATDSTPEATPTADLARQYAHYL